MQQQVETRDVCFEINLHIYNIGNGRIQALISHWESQNCFVLYILVCAVWFCWCWFPCFHSSDNHTLASHFLHKQCRWGIGQWGWRKLFVVWGIGCSGRSASGRRSRRLCTTHVQTGVAMGQSAQPLVCLCLGGGVSKGPGISSGSFQPPGGETREVELRMTYIWFSHSCHNSTHCFLYIYNHAYHS